MLSRNEDVPRFIEFFENKIKEGEIKSTTKFEKSKGKIKPLPDEKKKAKKQLDKMKNKKNDKNGGGNLEDL